MKEWNWLSEELDRLREQELYRTMTVLEGPQTTVVEAEGRPQRLFSSNNYLDLANDPEVKAAACEALEQYGVGAGGSRLTTGSGPLHVCLEEELARFKGREAALVFNTIHDQCGDHLRSDGARRCDLQRPAQPRQHH